MFRFQVLGQLAVSRNDQRLALGGTKSRRLLASLLCQGGQPVSSEALIDSLWGDEAPPTARKTLQIYVRRLRQLLGDDGRIAHGPAGYTLLTHPGEVDAEVFLDCLSRARQSRADDPKVALELYRQALALWQGRAYADVPEVGLLRETIVQLEEERLSGLEERLGVELSEGLHAEVIGELRSLAQANRYREKLHEHLMLALYRTGRQAEALEVYRDARALLTTELGVEPGQSLQRMHAAILRTDGSLDLGSGRPHKPDRAEGIVYRIAQLPPDVPDFTGRSKAIADLEDLADRLFQAQTVAITAITGPAGVGKTALAVHWAHRVADRFPDGQLYINLRGYDTEPPLRAVEALGTFLRVLGVEPERIPLEPDQAAAMFRSMVAGKRLLVLLDNAAAAEQVRPLLPASAGCLVLMTSRDRLTGLIARQGASRLSLDVLANEEATDLLLRILGRERVHREAEAVAQLASACGHLPLALRIAAATLADHPERSVSDHLADLYDGDPLAALSVDGDESYAVRAAFDQSYAGLPDAQRLLFRMLGLMPGTEFSREAAAAIVGEPLAEVERLLDRLARGHLVQTRPANRYQMHDLLRVYAKGLSRAKDDPAQRAAAMGRLHDYFLGRVEAAARLLYPQMRRLSSVTDPGSAFPDAAAALRWLQTEQSNLVGAIGQTCEIDRVSRRWILADALRGYFWLSQHSLDWFTAANAAHTAAQAQQDAQGCCAALASLGLAYHRIGDHANAKEHYQQAIAHGRSVGWLEGVATALDGLASASFESDGHSDELALALAEAIELNRQLGKEGSRANGLSNLGCVELERGQTQRAKELLLEALAIQQRLDSPSGQALALCNLALTSLTLGEHDAALAQINEAIALCRKLNNTIGEAITTRVLALVYRDMDRIAEALRHALASLELIRQSRDPNNEAEILNTLGSIYRRLGHLDQALTHHRDALELVGAYRGRRLESEAHAGLAESYLALAMPAQAQTHGTKALRLAEGHGYLAMVARARLALAGSAAQMGNLTLGAQHATAALEIYRAAADPGGQALAAEVLSKT